MKIKLVIIASFIVNMSVFAKDTIIFIGGGGEPLGEKETQFDESLENLGEFYKKNRSSYDAVVSFNGGHEKTEKKIKKHFSDADVKENFNTKNYEKIVDETIKKLSSNPPQIAPGEKIVLFINSHGAQRSGEKTHSISTANSAMTNMNAGGASMVSLDKLQRLSDLAEKNNVKLGIIDGSCHAGSTLALANSKTCVVTASGPDHYSYSDFADLFAKNMERGKNLEDIYFQTRNKLGGTGFPMISTPAGMAVQDEIYPYLTPYMYYHDEYRGMPLDKIDNYIKQNSSPELMCMKDAGFKKLDTLLVLIQQMSKVIERSDKTESVDLSKLRKKIAKYKKTQDEYFDKISQLNLSTLNKEETVQSKAFPKGNQYTHKELLSTNYLFQIKTKEEAAANPSLTETKKKQALDLADFYRECQRVKERVLRENPQYKEKEAIIAKLKDDSDVNYYVAKEIMNEAVYAYNIYYGIKQSEFIEKKTSAPNPCKDFVL